MRLADVITRRAFLKGVSATGLLALSPTLAVAAGAQPDRRLLVLVELKGGNDGLNTVVPYADPAYYALRPQIALRSENLVRLDERVALNKALSALLPLWSEGQLAVVQGVGYPEPNLSHFRSIEIWDTASKSDEYLQAGWITRVLARHPLPAGYAADAVVIGSADLGPVAGGSRAITLDNPAQFNRQARLVQALAAQGGGALAHVLKVEGDVLRAAQSLTTVPALKTAFPAQGFGRTCRVACETLAAAPGIGVLRLTLAGFDTHQNQTGIHNNLLGQLGEGLAALRQGLIELGRWDETLVMTYAEFGRRPKENLSGGTDHGTVAPHFVLGGRVRGGLYGETPSLALLDESGNLPYRIDFRQMYATVLERWWNVPATELLGGRFESLPLV